MCYYRYITHKINTANVNRRILCLYCSFTDKVENWKAAQLTQLH